MKALLLSKFGAFKFAQNMVAVSGIEFRYGGKDFFPDEVSGIKVKGYLRNKESEVCVFSTKWLDINKDLAEDINLVLGEIEAYIEGKRAQANLFDEEQQANGNADTSDAKEYLAQLASEGEDDEFVVGKVVKCHFPVIYVDQIIDNDRELHEQDYGITDYLSDVTQKQKNDLETMLTMTYKNWLEINHLESNVYGLDDEVLFRLNPITGDYEEDKSYANEMS